MAKVETVLDCKIVNGEQRYLVKWENSWVTANDLVDSCQDLVDEFWDYIDNCRHVGGFGPKPNKKRRLNDDHYDKSHHVDPTKKVQQQIARGGNKQTFKSEFAPSLQKASPGQVYLPQGIMQRNALHTPTKIKQEDDGPLEERNVLEKPHYTHQLASPQIKPELDQPTAYFNSPTGKGRGRGRGSSGISASPLTPKKAKVESNYAICTDDKAAVIAHALSFDSNAAITMGKEALKLIESWNNPYVRFILVCRVCDKEQKTLKPSNWKLHFLTHCDTKPYNCAICHKGFVQATAYKTHLKSHEKKSIPPS